MSRSCANWAALAELLEPPRLDDLLELDDFELWQATWRRLDFYAQEGDPVRSPAEQVVARISTAERVFADGGLEAVFEDARGCDPDFMGTLTALEEVGAEDAAKAYSEALAWFPGARPPDAKEARVRALRSIPQAERERASRLFWGAGDEVPRRLAAFIRTHQPELEAVLRARDAWRARRALRLP